MASIADTYAARRGAPLFICDFSPPRGGVVGQIADASLPEADWLLAAYNPGRAARANSAMTAHWVRTNSGRDVAFTLATRDMNRLATQSLLLGAALLGLQNVVVVRGDRFTAAEAQRVRAVNDYTPTELIADIATLNAGMDFRGRKLDTPTSLCVGASIDLARGIEAEVALTHRKVSAGAQFFIANSTFSPIAPLRFLERYADATGVEPPPVFWGVQVMAPGSASFGETPSWVYEDLRRGRSGIDIALGVLDEFYGEGLRAIYLLPPILRGGQRDYGAAAEVIRRFSPGK